MKTTVPYPKSEKFYNAKLQFCNDNNPNSFWVRTKDLRLVNSLRELAERPLHPDEKPKGDYYFIQIEVAKFF